MSSSLICTLLLLIICLFICNREVLSIRDACTAIIVGRNATIEGVTINTHTNDCFDCDFRIMQVPHQHHYTNSVNYNTTQQQQQQQQSQQQQQQQQPSDRPIRRMQFAYPRYVGNDRGSAFYQEYIDSELYNWEKSSTFGYIPQVNVTASYIDASYAFINEHGVSLGESTCGAIWPSAPIWDNGFALLDIRELGYIALERARTAREAILIMGELAMKYGYYTAEWGPNTEIEAGETYTVTDPFEAWIFHILPTPNGRSAIWVAQRVPDNHIAVITNSFIIRALPWPHEVNENYIMLSNNIFSIAQEEKLWSPQSGERLDFLSVYGVSQTIYREPYVSRRQWRVLSLSAPSLQLSPTLTSYELPFSVKPDKLLSVKDILSYHRDHFEGTPYDTTIGLDSGPYGNPNRYDQYEGLEATNEQNEKYITGLMTTIKQLFDTDNTMILDPTRSSRGISNELYQFLSQDDLSFSQLSFGKSINFTHWNYTKETIKYGLDLLANIQDGSIEHLLMQNNSTELSKKVIKLLQYDLYGIDRTQGEPVTTEILNKGFVERTISLFRTSFSHVTALYPSYSSQWYPNGQYLLYNPVYIPWFTQLHTDNKIRSYYSTIGKEITYFLIQYNNNNNNNTKNPLFLTQGQENINKNGNHHKNNIYNHEKIHHNDQNNGHNNNNNNNIINYQNVTMLHQVLHNIIQNIIPNAQYYPSLVIPLNLTTYLSQKIPSDFNLTSDFNLSHENKKYNSTLFFNALSKIPQSLTITALLDPHDPSYSWLLPPITLPYKETFRYTYLPRHVAYISYVSLHQPVSSSITPIFSALPTQLHRDFSTGSLWKYDQNSAWWAFASVSNYAEKYWRYMIRDIKYTQQTHENEIFETINNLQNDAKICVQSLIDGQNIDLTTFIDTYSPLFDDDDKKILSKFSSSNAHNNNNNNDDNLITTTVHTNTKNDKQKYISPNTRNSTLIAQPDGIIYETRNNQSVKDITIDTIINNNDNNNNNINVTNNLPISDDSNYKVSTSQEKYVLQLNNETTLEPTIITSENMLSLLENVYLTVTNNSSKLYKHHQNESSLYVSPNGTILMNNTQRLEHVLDLFAYAPVNSEFSLLDWIEVEFITYMRAIYNDTRGYTSLPSTHLTSTVQRPGDKILHNLSHNFGQTVSNSLSTNSPSVFIDFVHNNGSLSQNISIHQHNKHNIYNTTIAQSIQHVRPISSLKDALQLLININSTSSPSSSLSSPIRRIDIRHNCLTQHITQTHDFAFSISQKLLTTWKNLFHHLISRYRDGYRVDRPAQQEYTATPLFYPMNWLKATRFWRLSPGDPSCGRGNEYKQGNGYGIFALDTSVSRADASRFLEIDAQFNPGQHCLAPRLFNNTGPSEMIGRSYVETSLINREWSAMQKKLDLIAIDVANSIISLQNNTFNNNTNINNNTTVTAVNTNNSDENIVELNNISSFIDPTTGKQIWPTDLGAAAIAAAVSANNGLQLDNQQQLQQQQQQQYQQQLQQLLQYQQQLQQYQQQTSSSSPSSTTSTVPVFFPQQPGFNFALPSVTAFNGTILQPRLTQPFLPQVISSEVNNQPPSSIPPPAKPIPSQTTNVISLYLTFTLVAAGLVLLGYVLGRHSAQREFDPYFVRYNIDNGGGIYSNNSGRYSTYTGETQPLLATSQSLNSVRNQQSHQQSQSQQQHHHHHQHQHQHTSRQASTLVPQQPIASVPTAYKHSRKKQKQQINTSQTHQNSTQHHHSTPEVQPPQHADDLTLSKTLSHYSHGADIVGIDSPTSNHHS